jgi:PAS domain S-box-containing protein
MISESVLPSEGVSNPLKLSDIMNGEEIQIMMDNFYRFSKIPMAIIDLEGNKLVGVGWQDVCTKFHRVNPDSCRNCMESDLQLTTGIPQGEFLLYKCKNGMWDMATPIVIGDKHMGNLFIGQFFFEGEKIDYPYFKTQAADYNFVEKEYIEALERVPHLNKDDLEYAKAFFVMLSHSLSQLGYSNLQLSRLISDSEKAEKKLAESKSHLEKAEEIAHLGSWQLDLIDNRLVWSDEVYRIFGLEPGEFKTTYEAFLESIHPDDRVRVENAYSGSLRENRDVYEIEHRIVRRKSGEIRFVREKCEHLRDQNGTIVKSLGMVHDITEQKKVELGLIENEKRLRELNSTKDKFFSIISHDLKGPFTSIIGFSELLIERISKKDFTRAEEFATIINSSSLRAMDLLTNLTEWARVQTGRMEFNPGEADLIAIINEVIELLKAAVLQKSVSIMKALPLSLPVLADKAMISTVLRNLISNSIKFSYPDGKIFISAVTQGNEVRVEVRDFGVGINKVTIGRLFRAGESVSTTGTRNEEGTGLGLILCKEFISKHGGEIWVESEEQKGSTFSFTLPC